MPVLHAFNPDHARAYGLEEAVMIHSFQWWILRNRANGSNFLDGRTWTYNSYPAIAELFPYWTARKARRVLDSLVDQGVLLKRQQRLNRGQETKGGDATNWYAFSDEAAFLDPSNTHLPNSADGLPKSADGLPKSADGLPKSADGLPKSADVYKEQLLTTVTDYSCSPDTGNKAEALPTYPVGSREFRLQQDALEEIEQDFTAKADARAISEESCPAPNTERRTRPEVAASRDKPAPKSAAKTEPALMPDGTPRLTEQQATAVDQLTFRATGQIANNPEVHRYVREWFAAGGTVEAFAEIVEQGIAKKGEQGIGSMAYFRRQMEAWLQAKPVAPPAAPEAPAEPTENDRRLERFNRERIRIQQDLLKRRITMDQASVAFQAAKERWGDPNSFPSCPVSH